MSFSVALIGEGPVLTDSTRIFLQRGWQIEAFCSADSATLNWARSLALPVFSIEEIPQVDYLFSIANTLLLPDSVCRRARRHAINLHDGPLPRYAGLNVTTWALVEGERQHGITWHEVVEKIDGGDIFLQCLTTLAPDETSASLNLECQRLVQESLPRLLAGLESETLRPVRQDLSLRTFFAGSKVPPAWLDWRRPARELENLVRALEFGPFPNPVGTARVWNGARFQRVREAVRLGRTQSTPGTVLSRIPPDTLEIATGDGILRVRLEGELVSSNALPLLPDSVIDELARQSLTSRKAEKRWVEQLMIAARVLALTCPGKECGGEFVRGRGSLQRFLQWVTQNADGRYLLGWLPRERLRAPLDLTFAAALPLVVEVHNGRAFWSEPELAPPFLDLLARHPGLGHIERSAPEFRWPLMVGYGTLAPPPAPGTIQVLFEAGRVEWRWGSGCRREAILVLAERFEDEQNSQFHSMDSGAPGASLWDRLHRQSLRTPESTALYYAGSAYSYQDVFGKARSLAGALLETGVSREEPIGIWAGRCPGLIVAWLAVLQIGAVVVPLDTEWTTERTNYLLTRAQVKRILWDEDSQNLPQGREVIPISAAGTKAAAFATLPPENATFIYFTSGSTGEPKGVVLTGFAPGGFEWGPLPLQPEDRCCLWSSPAVIDAVSQILAPLLRGLSVTLLASEIVKDPRLFLLALQSEKLNRVLLLPSYAALLAEELASEPPSGSIWILTGEPLSGTTVQHLLARFPRVRLLNTYGATEAGEADTWISPDARSGEGPVPSGRPNPHTTVTIVDADFGEVAAEHRGEVCLGSRALARGYLGNPYATADRFRPAPDGARLYMTGDIGSLSTDGELSLWGRMDSQVKIRGQRVEPEGVRNLLVTHPQVEEAYVAVRDGRLVAFLTSGQRGRPEIAVLRQFLADRLVSASIPAIWIWLERLPRLPGGKIDGLRLTLPGAASSQSPEAVAPEVWKLFQVLLGEHIAPEDDFFHAGGDSLLAIRLVQQVERDFGVRLGLATFLQTRRLRDLAALVAKSNLQARVEGPAPAAQEAEPDVLITLRATGSAPPTFWVHGMGGTVLPFHELSQILGEDTPFYAFECRDPDAPDSVPRLARLYNRRMLETQPVGPYFIGGYSLGGLIAYEMARQLQASGHEVGMLTLVDTYGPGHLCIPSPFKIVQRMQTLWEMLCTLGVFFAQAWARRGLSWHAQLGGWRRRFQDFRMHFFSARYPGPAHAGLRQAGLDYRSCLEPYEGRVTLVRASVQKAGYPAWMCSGWSQTARSVDTIHVQATHLQDLLEAPAVGSWALQWMERFAAFKKSETIYLVVMNSESQYSIWPIHQAIPSGWAATGKQGERTECLAHIAKVWTDMRAHSLRGNFQDASRIG